MPGWQDDYEPVEDRIRAFWTEHPEGRIVTELVHHNDGDYIFRAEVFKLPPVTGASMTGGVQLPDATGYAHDSAAQLPGNMAASALEVCETSAIGRALANLGYAAKGKRPSREEMSKSVASEGSGSAPDSATPSGATSSSAAEANNGEESGTTTSTAAESSGEGATEEGAPSPEPNQETHVHGDWVDTKPDGGKLRSGFLRCTRMDRGKECGHIATKREAA